MTMTSPSGYKPFVTNFVQLAYFYFSTCAHHCPLLVQKVQLLTDTTVTSVATAGRRNRSSNTADAGALDANLVNFWRPTSLFVSATKVYVTDLKASIQEFDIDDFTAAAINDSWQAQYGGAKLNRYQGAKKAIATIVTDSSLTSGANFGYGHWNSGESGKAKKSHRGGWQCHARLSDCDYYRGWSTTTTIEVEAGTEVDPTTGAIKTLYKTVAEGSAHPIGQSKLCNSEPLREKVCKLPLEVMIANLESD